jgi:hypothetical protein
MKPERTVEMTGAWKTRKTTARFPFVSHSPWKSLRDSHIPTAPAASHVSKLSKPNSRKETLAADRFAPLQAHSSMRKCCTLGQDVTIVGYA